MASMIGSAARRIAPWRSADWRVLVIEGILLIAAGIYLLADGTRAESLLGVLVGAALFVDGLRQWALGRRLAGRPRDLTLVRGAVGIAAGGLVVLLSALQQITVVGVRIGVGLGGLVYGVIGLLLLVPAVRRREASWSAPVFDILLIAIAILLLYRVATADTIEGLLTVASWLIIAFGGVVVLFGLFRRRRPAPTEPPTTPMAPGPSSPEATDRG